MTRADLYDWVIAHGCKIETIADYNKANVIKVVNPANNRHCYLDLPIDDKPAKDYYVCKVCMVWLLIPLPNFCQMQEVAKEIQNKFYPDK